MPGRLYRKLYSYALDFRVKISIAIHERPNITSIYSQSSNDWVTILSKRDSVFTPLLSPLEAERFEGGLITWISLEQSSTKRSLISNSLRGSPPSPVARGYGIASNAEPARRYALSRFTWTKRLAASSV
jgi:hypothetical protein